MIFSVKNRRVILFFVENLVASWYNRNAYRILVAENTKRLKKQQELKR